MNAQDLKNSILQLAIQGKLVEQREEEGTAKELIDKVKAEKKQLIKDGKLKKQKTLPEINENEIPIEIPESWEWVKLGSICNVINGFTPSKSNPKFWSNGTIPWFTIADVRNQGRFINYTEQSISEEAISKKSNRIIPKDSVLLCCTASVGEFAYTNIALTTNQQFNGLVVKDEYKSVVHPMYIYEFAKTLKRTLLLQAGKTTINFVSVKKVSNIAIPLPPLEEQKRIVAKIEELLPHVDKYDAAYSEVEKLNKTFPEDMQKSILQYAVKGKLVEQREEEGTAERLFNQIQEEKRQLIKESKIKKTKKLPEITQDEIPFDIPDSWKWVRVNDVLQIINGDRGKNYPSKDKLTDRGIPFISALNLDKNSVSQEKLLFMSEEQYQKLGSGKLTKGDLVLCIRGSLGKNGRYPFDKGAIASSLVILRSYLDEECFYEYISQYINSGLFSNEVSKYNNGTAQPNLGARDLAKFIVPLPPIEEQKRIVEKIEELLSRCKQLIK